MARGAQLVAVLAIAAAPVAVGASDDRSPPTDSGGVVTGHGVGLDFSAGLIGQFASANVGVLLPKFDDSLQLGIRGSWSMPAIGLAHNTADRSRIMIYLPWMAYAGLFVHYGSGVVQDVVRGYGAAELFVGTTQALDSGVIGDNVTVGVNLYGGVEVYLNQRDVLFLEAGLSGVYTAEYGVPGLLGTSQHGGTGFFIRFGPRFYFGDP